MANKLWLPIHRTISPDSNGNTYWEKQSVNFGSNKRYDHDVLAFTSQSAKQGGAGIFTVPENYGSVPKIQVVWATTATSGDCGWAFAYSALGTVSLDPSTDTEAPASVFGTANGTARGKVATAIALTGSNLHAEDTVLFNFYRDGAAGGDTLAATAWLFQLMFEYLDG